MPLKFVVVVGFFEESRTAIGLLRHAQVNLAACAAIVYLVLDELFLVAVQIEMLN